MTEIVELIKRTWKPLAIEIVIMSAYFMVTYPEDHFIVNILKGIALTAVLFMVVFWKILSKSYPDENKKDKERTKKRKKRK